MKILKLVASATRWESGGVPLAGGRIQSPFSLSPKDCHFTQRHSVFVAKIIIVSENLLEKIFISKDFSVH